MNDIYSLSYELKDILSQDERVILLNKLEEEMNTNEEVMKLAYQKDVAVSNYSDALNHFDENSKEAKDWSTIKTKVKDSLHEFLFQKTKRNPMLIPIITEI